MLREKERLDVDLQGVKRYELKLTITRIRTCIIII